MPPLHESDIEQMLIDLLKAKGYQYLYGPDIAPDGENPMRASFEDVVLFDKLEKAVKRLNPSSGCGSVCEWLTFGGIRAEKRCR